MNNLPAIPTTQEFQTMKELGQMAIKSGFLPASIKTPEQAIVIILKGRELGIPPMQAFGGIAVINGKPAVGAELMLSMIYKNVPGAVVDIIKTDNSVCTIEGKRPGGKRTTFTFTIEDAKRAGLLSKDTWSKYPANMLRARCISNMARALFPDAIMGASYTPEELGAEVNEDGEIQSIVETQRDVTPPPSEESLTLETAVDNAVISKAAADHPGDFVIKRAKKVWQGRTIADVVNEIGLPQFIKDVDWWVTKSNVNNTHEIKSLAVNAERYAKILAAEKNAPQVPDADWDTAYTMAGGK